MENAPSSGLKPLIGIPIAGGYLITIPFVTSQARQYKDRLREFFRANHPGEKHFGPISVEIMISLYPGLPAIDLDNVAKAVLDGVKGHLFYDDAQVTRLLVEKFFGETEEITINIAPLKRD